MEEILAAGIHWRIVNFVIFLAMLFFALRKPARDFWVNRTESIRAAMEEGDRLRREAQVRYDELQKRVSQIEKESASMIRSLEEEGELEKKRLSLEAEKLSERLKKDSERIASQEIQKARELLKAEAATLSFELAEKLVRDNFKESDQKNLTDKYLVALKAGEGTRL